MRKNSDFPDRRIFNSLVVERLFKTKRGTGKGGKSNQYFVNALHLLQSIKIRLAIGTSIFFFFFKYVSKTYHVAKFSSSPLPPFPMKNQRYTHYKQLQFFAKN